MRKWCYNQMPESAFCYPYHWMSQSLFNKSITCLTAGWMSFVKTRKRTRKLFISLSTAAACCVCLFWMISTRAKRAEPEELKLGSMACCFCLQWRQSDLCSVSQKTCYIRQRSKVIIFFVKISSENVRRRNKVIENLSSQGEVSVCCMSNRSSLTIRIKGHCWDWQNQVGSR